MSDTDTRAFPPEPEDGPHPEKRFTVYVRCESAAFEGGWFTSEIQRILNDVTGRVVTGRVSGAIVDRNGVTVGNYRTTWRNEDPADRPPARQTRRRS